MLQSLKNTSLNNLDSDLQTMTLYEAITIYDGTEYVLDPLGEYVIDGYELYDSLTYPEHEYLTRYTESEPGVYVEDETGLYVQAFVAYTEPAYIGYDRYTHPDPSSLILRSLKDAEINNMDATINTLQLKDVIEIDETSSKMLQAMQYAYVGSTPPPGEKTLAETLDELTIGDMIDVTPSSPRVLRKFADSTVINLEDTINSLQLKDVIDIYDKIAYEEDENGFYVFDSYETYDPFTYPLHEHMDRYTESEPGIYVEDEAGDLVQVYVAYDPSIHDGLTRYTRTVGVDEFGQYYAYDTEGLYCSIYDTHEYDTHSANPTYADYPRYRMVDQSSTLLISLQDTYIYDEGTGETLTTRR